MKHSKLLEQFKQFLANVPILYPLIPLKHKKTFGFMVFLGVYGGIGTLARNGLKYENSSLILPNNL